MPATVLDAGGALRDPPTIGTSNEVAATVGTLVPGMVGARAGATVDLVDDLTVLMDLDMVVAFTVTETVYAETVDGKSQV